MLLNPAAGRRRGRRLDAILAAIERRGCAVALLKTDAPGDAIRLAGGVTRDEADVLVVAGGDGTVNEAVNGRPSDGPPVAVLPLGTANLLSREIGAPTAPAALADMVVAGPARPAWAGRADGRLFLVMAGAGFDAHVVAGVAGPLKRMLGKAAYGIVSLRLLAGGFGFPAYAVEIDGTAYPAASVVVANGRYYAGPYACARAASIDRPGFEVCLFERAGRGQVLRYATGLFTGRLEAMAGYRVVGGARRVVLRGPAGEPLQLDGDALGTLPAVIEPGAEPVPLVRPASR